MSTILALSPGEAIYFSGDNYTIADYFKTAASAMPHKSETANVPADRNPKKGGRKKLTPEQVEASRERKEVLANIKQKQNAQRDRAKAEKRETQKSKRKKRSALIAEAHRAKELLQSIDNRKLQFLPDAELLSDKVPQHLGLITTGVLAIPGKVGIRLLDRKTTIYITEGDDIGTAIEKFNIKHKITSII